MKNKTITITLDEQTSEIYQELIKNKVDVIGRIKMFILMEGTEILMNLKKSKK